MKESQAGSLISKALMAKHVRCMKLHGNEFQRGLPDYILWKKYGHVVTFELKIAHSIFEAVRKLTPGQRSIFNDLTLTINGAWIVYACDSVCGFGILTEPYDENKAFPSSTICWAFTVEHYGSLPKAIIAMCNAIEERLNASRV